MAYDSQSGQSPGPSADSGANYDHQGGAAAASDLVPALTQRHKRDVSYDH